MRGTNKNHPFQRAKDVGRYGTVHFLHHELDELRSQIGRIEGYVSPGGHSAVIKGRTSQGNSDASVV